VQGKPYIVRLLKQEQRAPKPLAEVSAEIRKALVPVKLKGAINEVAEDLMKTSNVEYMDK
jgi:hypothetical protein